jgi:hypothetical protein
VDEIQNVYEEGFGVRKSEQMRAEKIAMTKRFRDEEAIAGDGSGKLETSASSTVVHAEGSRTEKAGTAVLV